MKIIVANLLNLKWTLNLLIQYGAHLKRIAERNCTYFYLAKPLIREYCLYIVENLTNQMM